MLKTSRSTVVRAAIVTVYIVLGKVYEIVALDAERTENKSACELIHHCSFGGFTDGFPIGQALPLGPVTRLLFDRQSRYSNERRGARSRR
jgi:hypothetical protein